LKTILNPSRSRNSPGDGAAQACTINNTDMDHSSQRDKNHRHSAEAEALEATPWPEPIENSASGCAPSQLPPEHDSALEVQAAPKTPCSFSRSS